jgi:hypothetical protein
MQHLAGLVSDGVDDLGYVVAGTGREDSAEEVKVGDSLPVADVATLAADQFQRFVVVQRKPTRHHLTMTAQEFGMR